MQPQRAQRSQRERTMTYSADESDVEMESDTNLELDYNINDAKMDESGNLTFARFPHLESRAKKRSKERSKERSTTPFYDARKSYRRSKRDHSKKRGSTNVPTSSKILGKHKPVASRKARSERGIVYLSVCMFVCFLHISLKCIVLSRDA